MKRLLPRRRSPDTRTRATRLDHPLGEIRLQRKPIRHFYLRLDPADGALRVSAPNRASDRSVRAFVTERADWVDRQRERLAARPPVITADRLPERLHLFGVDHAIVHTTTGGRGCWRHADGVIHVEGADVDQARHRLREYCRHHLKALLAERVPGWAEHMALPRPDARIRRMSTRWGSCNIGARRIWLNLELIRMPVEAIDLVIVHELAHLIERGHNRRFYGVMDAAYPDWRRWESTLAEYGIIGL